MNFFLNKNLAFRIIFITALVSFLLGTALIYNYSAYKRRVTEATKQKLLEQATIATSSYEQDFKRLVVFADELAENITNAQVENEDINKFLEESLTEDAYYHYGVGVAFLPYLDDKDVRTNTPYYRYKKEKGELDVSKLIKVYSAPIYREDTVKHSKIKIGEVFVDFLLVSVYDVLSAQDLGNSGFAYLLMSDGKLVGHPKTEYNSKTISQIAYERKDHALIQLSKKAGQGEEGILEYQNEITGQDSWIFYQPITSVDWTLIVTFVKDDILLDAVYLQRQLIWISLVALVFLIALGGLLSRVDTTGTPNLIIFTVTVSLLLVAEIAYIWYLTTNLIQGDDQSFLKVVDVTSVNNNIKRFETRVKNICPTTKVFYIPTGLFMETIEFSNASNVFMSGTVWQKYHKSMVDSVTHGVFFPESVSETFTPAYKLERGDYIIEGWNYRVTIRKNFDYTRFPFDRLNMSLRILPKDFRNFIVLTPDLDAFTYTNPKLKPGISQALSIRGYAITSSYFAYKYNFFNVNFNLDNFDCRDKTPELFFNIALTRRFMGTVFSSTIPIVVMLSILFVLQAITTPNIDTVGRVLGPTGSFFFASLLAHIGLRDKLQVQDIVYFEYFYVLLYTMILYVFLNSVMYSREKKAQLLLYKNNLIFKLIFWPFFLFVLVLISLFVLLL